MAQIAYKTKCNKCESMVYYYPFKVFATPEENERYKLDMSKRVLTLTCDDKHQSSYEFPVKFTKI